MEKIILFATSVLVGCMTIISCGSSKQVAKGGLPYGAKSDLSEAESYAYGHATRAVGLGQSQRESTARNTALLDARAQMSSNMSSKIEGAWKSFDEQFDKRSNSENEGGIVRDGQGTYKEDILALTKELVSSTSIVKVTKFYNNTNHEWTYHVCIEYDGSVADMAKKAAEKLALRVSDQDRKNIESDRKKFEEEIEKKLAEM